MSDTCKRGHERNADNSRQRTVNSGGKTRVINECLACAREAKGSEGTASGGVRMTAPTNARQSPHTADPVVVEWYRYMTANARAHDDYTSRQTGCWPRRRCQRVFRHPKPRARHICSGVNGDALSSFPPGTCVVPDDPKALPLPAPATAAST